MSHPSQKVRWYWLPRHHRLQQRVLRSHSLFHTRPWECEDQCANSCYQSSEDRGKALFFSGVSSATCILRVSPLTVLMMKALNAFTLGFSSGAKILTTFVLPALLVYLTDALLAPTFDSGTSSKVNVIILSIRGSGNAFNRKKGKAENPRGL